MERYVKRGVSIILIILSLVLLSSDWMSLIGANVIQEKVEGAMQEVKLGLSILDYSDEITLPEEQKNEIIEISDMISDCHLSPKEEYIIASILKKYEKNVNALVSLVESFDSSIQTTKIRSAVKDIMKYSGMVKFVFIATIGFGIVSIISCVLFNGNYIQLVYVLLYAVIAVMNVLGSTKINQMIPADMGMETRLHMSLAFGVLSVLIATVLSVKDQAMISVFSDGNFKVNMNADTMKGVKERVAKASSTVQTAAHDTGSNVKTVIRAAGANMKTAASDTGSHMKAAMNRPKANVNADQTWICESCGAENTSESKFCGQCGSKRPEVQKEGNALIENLTRENEQLPQKVDELQEKFCSLEDANQNLSIENKQLVEENAHLKEQFETLKKEEKKVVPAKTKFCRYCGVKIPAESTICPECGKELY